MVGCAVRKSSRRRGLAALDVGFAVVLLILAYGLAFQALYGNLFRLGQDLQAAQQHSALADFADGLLKKCDGLIRCDSVAWSRVIDDSKMRNLGKEFRVSLNAKNKSGDECVVRFVVWRGKPAMLEVCGY